MLSSKQFLVAVALFVSAGAIIVAVTLTPLLRSIAEERASGFGIVLSPKTVIMSLAVVFVLLVGSVLVARKLVK
jgi:hypothetical protein